MRPLPLAVAAVLALAVVAAPRVRADVPYPTCADAGCADPSDFGSYLFLDAETLPDDFDPGAGSSWKYNAGTGINYGGFTMEIVDAGGEAVGVFVPGQGTIALDGGRVIGTVPETNRRRWTFSYQAPAAGTGPLTVYFAAVASIGAPEDDDDDDFVRAVDYTDDDTFVLEPFTACEAGIQCDRDPPEPDTATFDSPAHSYGCGASSGAGGLAGVVAIALLWWVTFARRRRAK